MTLFGQPAVSGYAEIGNSPVLGTFGTFAMIPEYKVHGLAVETGISLLGSGQKETLLDAVMLRGSYAFSVKQNPLGLALGYIWKQPSTELRETNIYLSVDYGLKHWYFLLGNNFRTYRLSGNYREEQGFSREDSRIRESWNLMYRVSFSVNAPQKSWNLITTITNVDYFLIEQETNPLFNLRGLYKPRQDLVLFMEAWYKTSGMLNIQVNHYGFQFRFGVTWDI